MQVDVLEQELERLQAEGKRIKMLYTIATFNTPTGWSMSLPRRRKLLDLASRYGFIVLEDNVYGELRYEGETIPTLFSLDESGLVVKIDSFSKILAPALRLGWVSGDPEVMRAIGAVKGDLGVSQWLARVVTRFMDEGKLDPHVAMVNELYREKRDIAVQALRDQCGPWVTLRRPGGRLLHLDRAVARRRRRAGDAESVRRRRRLPAGRAVLRRDRRRHAQAMVPARVHHGAQGRAGTRDHRARQSHRRQRAASTNLRQPTS